MGLWSLFLFRCSLVALMSGRCYFNKNWCFSLGHMGVFSNINRQVGVEGFQLFGKELVGQRVQAIRAPVQSGPFQQVKSGKGNKDVYFVLRGLIKKKS